MTDHDLIEVVRMASVNKENRIGTRDMLRESASCIQRLSAEVFMLRATVKSESDRADMRLMEREREIVHSQRLQELLRIILDEYTLRDELEAAVQGALR